MKPFKMTSLLWLLLPYMPWPLVSQVTLNTICYRIDEGVDDAEEFISPDRPLTAPGFVDLESATLELVNDPGDGGPGQLIGLRFKNIQVPKGAFVSDAYLEFTVAEADNFPNQEAGETSVLVMAEAIDDAPPFIATANNLSDRLLTEALIPWNLIPSWTTVGQSGPLQRTPNLAGIIQEVVNRNGWANGNNLVFIISGLGRRVGAAFDGNPDFAPRLCITLSDCPPAGTACNDGDLSTADDRHDGSCNCTGVPRSGSICLRIEDGLNDVEQIQDGSMYLNSTDLELTFDDNPNENRGNQIVGLRFESLPVPQGASVSDAYLQFTVDEVNEELTNLLILSEDADHSKPFTILQNDISDRPTAPAAVFWTNILAWTEVGQAGAFQRSPDVSGIIEEVVSRSGWQAGNALTFIISGSGQRTAVAYEGNPSQATQLCFSYQKCLPAGTACDDGDPSTLDDREDGQCNCVGIARDGSTMAVINASSDDAEEFSSGFVKLNGPDLEMVDDPEEGGIGQTVGLRFSHVGLPKDPNLEILYASIQLTSDNFRVDDQTTDLVIFGEATGNAVPFASTDFNLSNRSKTAASVSVGNVPPWTTPGSRGQDQAFEVTSIVREITRRADWQSWNAMAFLITGNGRRTAEAYDDIPGQGASLYIAYEIMSEPDPANPCGGTDCLYFQDCSITNGGTVQVACDDDLSDAALQQKFAIRRSGHYPTCAEPCSTIKTPFFRRSSSASLKSTPKAPNKLRTNGAVCYVEQIVWGNQCAEGGVSDLSVTMEVIDYHPPSFELPPDITISCNENPADLSITGNITKVTDNCGIADICFTDTRTDGSSGAVSCSVETTIVRRWEVTDNCGNVTSKSQLIRIMPAVPCSDPCIVVSCSWSCGDVIQLSCEDDLSDSGIQAGFGECFVNNCQPGTEPVFQRQPLSGNNIVVSNCSLADDCVLYREQLSWTFPTGTLFLILEVKDLSAPAFVRPPDVHVFCDELHDLRKTGSISGLQENCGGATISYSDNIDASACLEESQVIRSWIVRDVCGNETVQQQLIAVYPRGCTFGVIDEIVFIGPVQPGDYYVNSLMESGRPIPASSAVGFYAGQRILLTPGFQVPRGSEFKAAIADCDETIAINDLCINAIELTCSAPLIWSAAPATRRDAYHLENCNYPEQDPAPNAGVWFYFTSQVTGLVDIYEWSNDRIRVFGGTCSALEYITCNKYQVDVTVVNEEPITLAVVAGETYYLYLDSYDGAGLAGDYTILVEGCSNAIQQVPQAGMEVFGEIAEVADLQIFPNPLQSEATITYKLADTGRVQLELFDLNGRQVRILLPSTQQDSGEYALSLSANGLPGGIYFIRLQTSDRVLMKRLIIQ